ncbi:MAG: hypothetical protein EXQ95_07770 [Alphaproteobacteria bacterium]|nr:hypothetical protein [Alphaproteobacteria bacterium]
MNTLAAIRLGMCVAAALLTGPLAADAAQSSMAVEASSGEGGARLRFLWPDRVAATSNPDGSAVIVTVDREVDSAAVRDAVAMLPAWIESAKAEGRQLRLVPQPGRNVSVTPLARGIEIRLTGTRAAGVVAQAPAPSRPPTPIPAPEPPKPPAPRAVEAPKPEAIAPPAARPDPIVRQLGAITIVPARGEVAQAVPAPVDAETAAAARRLRLTKARLMMETGAAQDAKAELEALLAEVPSSVEVMAALASVETQLGGWRRAVGLYDRALGLNPDDPSLVRAKAELLREYGPRVRFDVDHRKVKKADRQIVARLSGEALAGTSVVGFAVEGNDLNAPVVRRLDGTLGSFDGKRFRGEGYTSIEHETGGLTRLSLIGGTGTVGAAVRHTRPLAEGTVRLGLILHDPYWDVVDGLVSQARTDRAQIGYERIIGTGWRVAGRLAAGRYGVDGRSDVAHFVGPGFELAYTVVQGPPSLTLAYGVDAEYLASRKTAVDSFGLEYPLLSVVSREVHSGTAGLSGNLAQDVRYNVYSGYAYDRLNANGPFFGADLAFEPYTSLELGMVVSHSLTASRGTDATVTRIGGYLLWRY